MAAIGQGGPYMVVIIADEGKNKIGAELHREFLSKGVETEYIPLDNVQVKPCVNCGGCTCKTYGKCVVRDDGDWIYPKVIRSESLVLVTPITFGSYSFKIKRVLDKFGLIMDRHYFVEKKELVKGGMQGRQFRMFTVGVSEDCISGETEAFKKLLRETLIITRGTGKAYITGALLSSHTKKEIIEEVADL